MVMMEESGNQRKMIALRLRVPNKEGDKFHPLTQ